MSPRPRQYPHPPLFVAANSENSVRSAAHMGLPTLSSFFVLAWGMRIVHIAESRFRTT